MTDDTSFQDSTGATGDTPIASTTDTADTPAAPDGALSEPITGDGTGTPLPPIGEGHTEHFVDSTDASER